MWVITVFSNGACIMYEFNTEKEARESFKNIQGCKYLTEIVYDNDHCSSLVAI